MLTSMKSNINLHTKKYLALVWQKFGDKYKRGFKPDYVSGHFVRFFCQERAEYFPKLKDYPTMGLFVIGTKGIGKTINFYAYRKIQSKNSGIGMRIISAKEIETNFKINGEKFIDELIKCPELMIDDIGTESQTLKDYGTDRNLVHDIIIQRYVGFQRGENITHGTSNLNVDLLKKFYDSRLIDRMKEMFILVKVIGESKR
jgi:DNA replication protein DnaC